MPTIQQATVDRHTEPEQRRQFVKIPTDIVRDKTLSRTARLLYAEIRTFAWESIDSECYASQATLADHLGCSVKTVQRAAKELTERGLISCRHTQGTNRYQPERRSQGDAGVVPGATLVSHEAEKKAEEEKQSGGGGGGTPRAAEIATTTLTASTTPSEPEEIRDGVYVGDDGQELEDLADSLLLAYDLAVYEAGGGERSPAAFKAVAAKVRRGAGDVEAALGLARDGVDELEFGAVVLFGLTKSDDFTVRHFASGFRVAAKSFASVRGQWAAAPRVRCSNHSADCEWEFIPDAAQRRTLRKLGATAALECPACQRAQRE